MPGKRTHAGRGRCQQGADGGQGKVSGRQRATTTVSPLHMWSRAGGILNVGFGSMWPQAQTARKAAVRGPPHMTPARPAGLAGGDGRPHRPDCNHPASHTGTWRRSRPPRQASNGPPPGVCRWRLGRTDTAPHPGGTPSWYRGPDAFRSPHADEASCYTSTYLATALLKYSLSSWDATTTMVVTGSAGPDGTGWSAGLVGGRVQGLAGTGRTDQPANRNVQEVCLLAVRTVAESWWLRSNLPLAQTRVVCELGGTCLGPGTGFLSRRLSTAYSMTLKDLHESITHLW